MFKWFFGIGVAGVLILVAIAYFLYSNLNVFVEQAIEQFGSEAVGVAVRVDRVELELDEGRASVFGLRVANPPGFKGESAFRLGEITVQIDLESLSEQNPIVFDEIRIESPVVFYELNSARKSNLDVLRAGASGGSEEATSEPEADDSQPPLRMRIRKLRFAGGRVEADTRGLGGVQLNADLATAELTDVGGAQGATGGEIGSALVRELGRATVVAIGRAPLDKVIKQEGGKAVEGLLNRFGR